MKNETRKRIIRWLLAVFILSGIVAVLLLRYYQDVLQQFLPDVLKSRQEIEKREAELAAMPKPDLFFGTLAGHVSTPTGTQPQVYIKYINLPDDAREKPVIKAGEKWWLGGDGASVTEVTCTKVEPTSGVPGFLGGPGLLVSVQSGTPLPGSYWLFSKNPLPVQTWQSREEPADGNTSRVIVATLNGEFRLDSVDIPSKAGEEEGDGPAEVRVDVYHRDGKGGPWKKISSFMTNSDVRPYLDVDGDGVPEIISEVWYNSIALQSFYSKKKVVVFNRSGV